MRIRSYLLSSLLIAGLVVSCTSSAEKKAEIDFQRVDTLVASHELSSALQLLDSIMVWNEGDFGIVGKALKKRNSLGKNYHQGVIDTSEILLKGLKSQIAELSKDFIFKPGEPGQPGFYEHKRQTVESSWNRTFLKIGISENGDVWLVSHYYGKDWINHTSVRVYNQSDYVLTDTIGMGHEWNRKVEDMGDKWETIEFRQGSDAGALAFIADNYQKSVKARLTGKTFHYIVLESFDKEAIHKGWELAQVLKEAYGLRETIKLNQSEMRKLGGAADAE